MKRFILFILIGTSASLFAQEETDEPRKLTMKGYLKDMASITFLSDSSLFQNLVHNRLNFAWYPHETFTVHLEIRSRLVSGDYVKKFPGYETIVDSNNDYFDMSANLVESNSSVLNVMADRAYIQWTRNKWEITAGRQRINWGVNLAWNPNDLFNAYSYFDFDYEERPGSDAMRIVHYTGVASSVEVAAKMADEPDNFVGAAMWKLNEWNYDFQFLGGFAQGDLAIGTGWAGNISKAGFKGELTWFKNMIETDVNFLYSSMLLGAISIDYSFPSSFYLNGSIMYNSQGTTNPSIGFAFLATRPGTVRSLSPYKWSSFIQSSYQINPLLYGGVALIGYPGSKDFFVNPTLTLSLKQNLDLDLVGQLFWGEDFFGDYGSIAKAIFLRLKWSF